MAFKSKSLFTLLAISLMLASPMFSSADNLADNFDIVWGLNTGKVQNYGDILQLSLDQGSGSGFQSKREYHFRKIDMQIKLVPGNYTGTVTTYYLSSQGGANDEIDFKFLGNLSRDPYILHTNLYAQGKDDKEQQFCLWFDPSADFHTCTILWNPKTVVWYVDGSLIRGFRNQEHLDIPFPKDQPMRLYFMIWSADDWATRGRTVKTDWSQAAFITSYRNFNVDESQPLNLGLDEASRGQMLQTQNNYMIYNYCTDVNRFPQGLPPECNAKSA